MSAVSLADSCRDSVDVESVVADERGDDGVDDDHVPSSSLDRSCCCRRVEVDAAED